MVLQHGLHPELVAFTLGRVGQDILFVAARNGLILTCHAVEGDRMARRLDILGIHLFEHFELLQDVGQLLLELLDILFAEAQAA